jgi:hypothetical protein
MLRNSITERERKSDAHFAQLTTHSPPCAASSSSLLLLLLLLLLTARLGRRAAAAWPDLAAGGRLRT